MKLVLFLIFYFNFLVDLVGLVEFGRFLEFFWERGLHFTGGGRYRYCESIRKGSCVWNFTNERSEKDFTIKFKEDKHMAINLSTLNLSEAVLVRPTNIQPVSYRLNQDKIKENWETLKAQSKPLLKVDPQFQEAVSKIEALPEVERVQNYSVETFFRKNLPSVTDGDGNYTIRGVKFTKEELEQCNMVMRTAVEGIGSGIGECANIDYRNYAQIGIATSGVRSYAAEYLNDEQAAVVNGAMEEYRQALLDSQEKWLAKQELVDTPYDGLTDYYGISRVFGEDEIEIFNTMKKKLAEMNGKEYVPFDSDYASVVTVATNRELIEGIETIFSDINPKDGTSMQSAMEQYKKLMSPAYIAHGINDNHGSLTNVLNKDISEFQKQMNSILAAVTYRPVNITV